MQHHNILHECQQIVEAWTAKLALIDNVQMYLLPSLPLQVITDVALL